MAARLRRLGDADRVAVARGVLLDQDRVGAARHRRAGEDADRLAGRDGAVEGVARGGHAGDAEGGAERRLGTAERVAIHRRGGKRRLGAERGEIRRQHPAGGLGQRHGLGAERLETRGDAGDRLVDRQEAHAPFLHVPERPPLFSTRWMPVIAMPRSRALAMS